MFLLWEGITGKPANERIVVTLTWLGLGMILSLMMWVFYMDIRNLGGG
jgi:regulator of sigma E protease